MKLDPAPWLSVRFPPVAAIVPVLLLAIPVPIETVSPPFSVIVAPFVSAPVIVAAPFAIVIVPRFSTSPTIARAPVAPSPSEEVMVAPAAFTRAPPTIESDAL